eukprot:CAMPEP_0119146362 /NCGR_PEP_ID=MMETSP1310-20130426/38801_1 /TAXON_ID=464262 /ORGANISM="Genus nov. species nov., Strain RCC2339" /LENGTH=207 /DNA_ID=CAMNT_0007138247 /DNA_START=94 /DNA_END=714 /DNA_ORIENTATION=+
MATDRVREKYDKMVMLLCTKLNGGFNLVEKILEDNIPVKFRRAYVSYAAATANSAPSQPIIALIARVTHVANQLGEVDKIFESNRGIALNNPIPVGKDGFVFQPNPTKDHSEAEMVRFKYETIVAKFAEGLQRNLDVCEAVCQSLAYKTGVTLRTTPSKIQGQPTSIGHVVVKLVDRVLNTQRAVQTIMQALPSEYQPTSVPAKATS